jgi:hypothetical protein
VVGVESLDQRGDFGVLFEARRRQIDVDVPDLRGVVRSDTIRRAALAETARREP